MFIKDDREPDLTSNAKPARDRADDFPERIERPDRNGELARRGLKLFPSADHVRFVQILLGRRFRH